MCNDKYTRIGSLSWHSSYNILKRRGLLNLKKIEIIKSELLDMCETFSECTKNKGELERWKMMEKAIEELN
jgi:hypothetical protein